MKKIAIVAFTENGKKIQDDIKKGFSDCEFITYEKPERLRSFTDRAWKESGAIIFVSATGIAVRMIAPLVKAKDKDPAVVVIDDGAKHVISLLSGHLGGANALTEKIAELLGSDPVITTSTDVNDKFAVDVWTEENGLYIINKIMIKFISSAILRGEKPGFVSELQVEGKIDKDLMQINTGEKKESLPETGIVVSVDQEKKPFKKTLNAVPKIITLGLGCRKNKDPDEFEESVLKILREQKISIKAVRKMASIDLKKDEECMLRFSEKYEIPFETYTADELNTVEGSYQASDFVKKITGTDNVCERSAKKASTGSNGEIILKKESYNGMTMAIAKDEKKLKF